MSRIYAMISELCPEGAPYLGVTEVAEYVRGITYNNGNVQSDGPTRVLRANNITLSSNTLNFEDMKRVSGSVRVRDNQRLRCGDILICAGSGSKAHIGKVAYVAEDLQETFGGFMGVIRSKGNIDPRFLFHLLTGGSFAKYLEGALSTTTINNLNNRVMAGFRIPVPPLEVQREIVRILDQFTQLEADLEAELEARRQQYEHYRDELLAISERSEIGWSTLGEVSTRVSSGATPRAGQSDYYQDGTIPWLRTQEVKFVDIWDTDIRITEKALEETATKWIPANCVIVAISGATAGRSAVNRIPVTTNQHCCNFEVDPAQVNYRYVFYWVRSQYEQIKALGQGARSDLNASIIKGVKIPVPPLTEQARIVEVLDKFDALVNDLSIGLPAELAARRKQYEYYRDQLLTFEEAPV